MKRLIAAGLFIIPTLSTYALDCTSPTYANNPRLKQSCLQLQQAAQTSIQSTQDRFAKDYSQNQLLLDAQMKDEEMKESESGQQPGAAVTGTQKAPVATPPAYTAPPAPAPSVAPAPPAAPSPASKPRRYY